MERDPLQRYRPRASVSTFSLASCLCGDDFDDIDNEGPHVLRLLSKISISPILFERFAPLTRYLTARDLGSDSSHPQPVALNTALDITPPKMLKLHRRAYVRHPTSVSARYTYSPLKDDEIRVIWLEKGSFSSEIVIRLEVRKRTTDDPYEAVSYAWGNKLEMGTIKVRVQGTTGSYSDLQVRDNVVTMLRHLRARSRRLPLWIDAICINQGRFGESSQENTAVKKEKAVQVQLMGDVYRGTTRTLVWLGHAKTTLLRNLDETWPNQNSVEKVKLGVKPLLNTPYFTRRWIIQELFLSKKVLLLDGHDEIDFEILVKASDFILKNIHHHDRTENRRLLNALHLIHILQELRLQEGIHTEGVQDFMRLLVSAHISDCKDPLDRLYALGALEKSGRKPDYNLDADEVFLKFAKDECKQSLETLYCSGAFPATTRNLPSWAPDWRSPRAWIPISLMHGQDVRESKFAPVMRKSGLHPQTRLEVGSKTLVVHGMVMSEIDSIACVSTIGGLLKFYQHYSHRRRFKDDQDVELLVRTLTLDSVRSGHIAHAWLQTYRASNGEICPLEKHESECDHLESQSIYECNVLRRIEDVMTGRCAFITQDGHWAVGPRGAQEGDFMVRLDGCRFPFVMRRQVSSHRPRSDM